MPTFSLEGPQNLPQVPLSRATKGLTKDDAHAVNHGAVTKPWAHLIAGASGGMATAVLTSPLDVLRTMLQSEFYRSQLHQSSGLRGPPPSISTQPIRSSVLHIGETFQILFSIHRVEGWRGLFRGLGPSLTGVVPATTIKFYTYGNCKRLVSEKLNRGKDAAVVHIISAATAGIATSIATNPIWLVKTRLQLDRSHADKAGVPTVRRYKNSLDCINQVLHQEGFRGFYRGLSASFLGAAETTLHLTLYEQMKILLARKEERVDSTARGKTTWDQVADWASTSGAAAASKLLAGLVAYPHEVVRTRLRQAPMENGLQKYTGLIQCFRLILKEGFMSMYGGLTPHLLRGVPSAAITLGAYESVLKLLNAQS